MTGTFLPAPVFRAVDASGAPLPGAQLQFYLTGTTTPAGVYASASLGTALSNPVVADSGGLFAPIYVDPTVTYRAQLLNAAGTLIRDIDPVATPATIANGAVTAAMLAGGAALSNLGYTPLNKAGDTATNLVIANSALANNSAGYLGAPLNEQDASYTLALADAGRLLRANSASGIAYTIPERSAVAWPIGTAIVFRNWGAGVVTITRGTGVALFLAGGSTNKDVALAQYGLATAIMELGDVWVISGVGIS